MASLSTAAAIIIAAIIIVLGYGYFHSNPSLLATTSISTTTTIPPYTNLLTASNFSYPKLYLFQFTHLSTLKQLNVSYTIKISQLSSQQFIIGHTYNESQIESYNHNFTLNSVYLNFTDLSYGNNSRINFEPSPLLTYPNAAIQAANGTTYNGFSVVSIFYKKPLNFSTSCIYTNRNLCYNPSSNESLNFAKDGYASLLEGYVIPYSLGNLNLSSGLDVLQNIQQSYPSNLILTNTSQSSYLGYSCTSFSADNTTILRGTTYILKLRGCLSNEYYVPLYWSFTYSNSTYTIYSENVTATSIGGPVSSSYVSNIPHP